MAKGYNPAALIAFIHAESFITKISADDCPFTDEGIVFSALFLYISPWLFGQGKFALVVIK